MGRACNALWERRNAYWIFGGRPERKRPLGRPRRRWEDIEMDAVVGTGLNWLRIGTSGGLL
jgi:hypothetical protein